MSNRIPIIDLAASFSHDAGARQAIARQIDAACRDTGFFYVVNHGVRRDVVKGMFAASRALFALPADVKRTAKMIAPSNRGYEGVGAQRLQDDAPPDQKESMMVGIDLPPDDPYTKLGVANYGANRWPEGHPEFAAPVARYHADTLALGRHLLRLFAIALDQPENFFIASMEMPIATLRMIHYPPLAAGAPADAVGAGLHTDWGAITVLAQDDIGGLQVKGANDEWIAATPVADAFVINIGDMMQRWTNDFYRSTPHRVLNNRSGRDRYSAAMFIDLNYFTRVECLANCVTAARPARYAPCTAGEHIAEMYQHTYARPAGA